MSNPNQAPEDLYKQLEDNHLYDIGKWRAYINNFAFVSQQGYFSANIATVKCK